MEKETKKPAAKRGARRLSGRLCTFYLSNDSDACVNALGDRFGSRSRAVNYAVMILNKLVIAEQVNLKEIELPTCNVEITHYKLHTPSSGSEGSPA